MRTPDSPINTMVVFWYLVYALALFSVFVGRILARNQDARKAQAARNNQRHHRVNPQD
jgi:hypothetical protein